jgi:hypothetical protein
VRPAKFTPVLFTILACAVACVAVSSQSLWIDEAEVANIINHPAFRGFWHALQLDHTSNMQAPLYFSYIWGWTRFFGESEFAMRAANIPWFFVGLFAISHFLRRHPGLRSATLLLFCLHPFVWYYLDEARPYSMQLAGALVVCGALFTALDQPDEPLPASWWWLLAPGLVILCGASFVGVPWAIGITILLMRRPGFWQSLRRSGLPPVIVSVPWLALLALYYAWTIKEKIRSGYLPMTAASSLAIFYEQIGFLGLGPGRATLRAASVSSVRPFLLPLALLALPLAWGMIVAGRRRFGLTTVQLVSLLLLAGSCLCLILTFGFLHHARILARHLTPLFPFILLTQAYAILLLWRSGRALDRGAAFLIVIALTLSSVEVRCAFRHSKDDYRSAAAAAKEALSQGKTVWWAADTDGAKYYRLPLSGDGVRSAYVVGKVPTRLPAPPDEIFLSKPDLFDSSGAVADFIATHHYIPTATWQTFTLWQKPSVAR